MSNLRRGALGGSAALAALAGLVLTSLTPISPASGTEPLPELMRNADEEVAVVEVTLADHTELDRLVDTGVDLDHSAHLNPDGTLTAHAVITDSEGEALRARGFSVGTTVHEEEDTEAVLAEREATIAAAVEENEEFAAAAESATVSDVKIIRADYYTSFGVGYLSVEAKWADGQTSSSQLTVERDSGPGSELGSGGTQNISRFVDAGVYLYHRGAATVETRPDTIRIVSPTGDVAIAKVNDWLPIEGEPTWGPNYQTDFITSYLTPTELYDRVKALAASTTSPCARRASASTTPGSSGCALPAIPTAGRSIASTSARSICASRTGCLSRSPATGRASPPMSPSRRWARDFRCRLSSSRSERRSRPG